MKFPLSMFAYQLLLELFMSSLYIHAGELSWESLPWLEGVTTPQISLFS